MNFIVTAAIHVSAAPTGSSSNLPGILVKENRLIPATSVLDGKRLSNTKYSLGRRDSDLSVVLDKLKAQADSWLIQGPWSVTTSKKLPPGGDIHDYASQAPYWWPSSNTTDGCPYIQRDGQRNPESDEYTNHADRGKMFQSSYILSLAWYYTGQDNYAKHAGDILRTWFITAETRMNPNLDHAQIIPCQNEGRSIGIIDFSQGYTSVVDAAAILATGAPGWSKDDQRSFRDWNIQFLQWLNQSDFGKEENAAENNHGTFAAMQIAALALFTGDKQLATQKVLFGETLINRQIAANGTQPIEIARTRSWHYSTLNIVAVTRLAAIGRKVGIDIWRYQGPDRQNLFNAIKFLIPYATGTAKWEYKELEFHAYAATDIIHAAADAGLGDAKQAVEKFEPPPGGDLWPLRPAPEQLDAIS
ncbi:chondroitin AC/alginate lyase [Zopfia rhizophila CBS 207.26]|uniref:Chondroitin AC/alginate lyase n=1 Tax=Zopfia rhizophila CBS 207.26 TaxID=1314779 RepID=A0A6A6EPV6_9PEZI|nr:chondroitin AC/alginate lyase [Zopfia rhizophila CBS 207.26]